ncbi:hypothetical protein BS50DRAFT_568454 [Corynespora cassiicola Philippines]|uniref:Uncharacterized protein n=1 Tax=Corynespora cassiicola Philippines TaxID=1448308 RepID=A0A2T2P557_CORCC|nr:hypothetical protein BS50DRAFT_568454 [Corynespora cassiicola Philippines]
MDILSNGYRSITLYAFPKKTTYLSTITARRSTNERDNIKDHICLTTQGISPNMQLDASITFGISLPRQKQHALWTIHHDQHISHHPSRHPPANALKPAPSRPVSSQAAMDTTRLEKPSPAPTPSP